MHGRDRYKRATWLCQCDCGRQIVVRSNTLRRGATRSCGCLQKQTAAENGLKSRGRVIGAKHYRWKPELTEKERLERRQSPQLAEWRRAVFERDEYRCDLCGLYGGKLHAHHLNSWSAYPKLRFDVSNGVTLCKAHHDEFHDYNGGPRFSCTEADYQRFRSEYGSERMRRFRESRSQPKVRKKAKTLKPEQLEMIWTVRGKISPEQTAVLCGVNLHTVWAVLNERLRRLEATP